MCATGCCSGQGDVLGDRVLERMVPVMPADSFSSSVRPALWWDWKCSGGEETGMIDMASTSWIAPPTQSMTNTGRWAAHSAPGSSHHIARWSSSGAHLCLLLSDATTATVTPSPTHSHSARTVRRNVLISLTGPTSRLLTTEDGLSL